MANGVPAGRANLGGELREAAREDKETMNGGEKKAFEFEGFVFTSAETVWKSDANTTIHYAP